MPHCPKSDQIVMGDGKRAGENDESAIVIRSSQPRGR
jgi:hypothetical protein